MGLFLSIFGFLIVPTAIAWLIFSFFKKKKKLLPALSIVAGILICLTGLMIVGANVTPEELARIEENKKARAEAKEAKLEAERHEKEEEEKKLEEEAKEMEIAKTEKKKQDELTRQEEKKKLVASHKADEDRVAKEEVAKERKEATQASEESQNDSIEVKAKKIAYEIFKFGKDSIDETVQEISYDESEKTLSITVKGKDGWSDKSIGLGFYEDSTSFYREISKDQSLQEVWLTITFPMQDVYGNIEDEEVMGTWLSRETMDKINWKSFSYYDLLDVVDGKRIYPQFVQ